MTLISMLLALIIERLAVRSDAWQASRYCRAYVRFTANSGLSKLALNSLGQYVWLALPGAVVAERSVTLTAPITGQIRTLAEEIVREVCALPTGKRILVLAPLVTHARVPLACMFRPACHHRAMLFWA